MTEEEKQREGKGRDRPRLTREPRRKLEAGLGTESKWGE